MTPKIFFRQITIRNKYLCYISLRNVLTKGTVYVYYQSRVNWQTSWSIKSFTILLTNFCCILIQKLFQSFVNYGKNSYLHFSHLLITCQCCSFAWLWWVIIAELSYTPRPVKILNKRNYRQNLLPDKPSRFSTSAKC